MLWVGQRVFRYSIKYKIDKRKNKLDFIKIESFVLQRTPSRKQKRQLVEKWEEIFANHIFDKGPLSRIYKELKKKKTLLK